MVRGLEQKMLQELFGIGKAIELIYDEFENYNAKLIGLRNYFIKQIEEKIDDVKLNGDRINRLPGNVNFSFTNVDAGELLLNLDAEGICASAGSACTSGSVEPSHVLVAIGLNEEHTKGALRVTFGRDNYKDDVDFLIDNICRYVEKLREQN